MQGLGDYISGQLQPILHPGDWIHQQNQLWHTNPYEQTIRAVGYGLAGMGGKALADLGINFYENHFGGSTPQETNNSYLTDPGMLNYSPDPSLAMPSTDDSNFTMPDFSHYSDPATGTNSDGTFNASDTSNPYNIAASQAGPQQSSFGLGWGTTNRGDVARGLQAGIGDRGMRLHQARGGDVVMNPDGSYNRDLSQPQNGLGVNKGLLLAAALDDVKRRHEAQQSGA